MRFRLLDDLRQDLRDGARRLRSAPTFAVVAVITLALGIGANTAFFSVLNAVILRPLPYPGPDRLVQLLERNPARAAELGQPSRGVPLSAHNYRDYRAQNTLFEEMGWAAPLGDRGSVNVVGADRPLRVPGVSMSASFFRVLGIEPLLGAVWPESADIFTFEGPRVVILGHGFWEQRYAADPGVLGRALTIDGWPHTIVGVMPEHFRMPPLLTRGELGTSQGLFDTGDLYVPLNYNAYGLARRARQFTTVARLRAGIGLAEAQAEMSALAEGLAEAYPAANEGWEVEVRSLSDLVGEELGPRLWLLLAAVGLALLIACVNIAHLLLARAVGRRTEFAVRSALGAGRGRLVRQLLTESLLLATLGGGAGLLLAYAGLQALVQLVPPGVPRAEEASIDPTVLLFTLGLTLTTGLLFGLAPAWSGGRVELAAALQGRGRIVGASRRGGSPTLLAVQVGVALVLLMGAGLLTRSFLRLTLAEPGYNPDHLLRVSLYIGRPSVYNDTFWDCDLDRPGALLWGDRCRPNGDERRQFFTRVLDRVEQLPGVVSAALTDQAPLVDGPGFFPLRLEPRAGETEPSDGRGVLVGSSSGRAVYQGYFDTMEIRVLRGRAFAPGDVDGWGGVAVINERLASRVWPDSDPIGQRFSFFGGDWMTVIGVVENTVDATLRDRTTDDGRLEGKVFFLGHDIFMDLIVRVEGDPLMMAGPVEDAVLEVDAGLPLGSVASLDQLARESNAMPRFYALMVGLFAVFSLMLTAVGLYGAVTTAAAGRTREIGIRMALGATTRQVRGLLISQIVWPVTVGLALGAVGTVALTGVLGALLYGMNPVDPLTFAAVAGLLLSVVLLATYLPAHRASRLEPTPALRTE